MAQKLSFIPHIERLSERVTRVLGCNPGSFTLQGTNTYLVGTGNRKILIDTGEPDKPEYIVNLLKALEDLRCSIQEIVITHWHGDHVGGVPDVCREVMNSTETKVSKFKRLSQPDRDLGKISYNFVENNHIFKTEGATLRAIHTPGHTEEHMSLQLEEENAIFSGDTVLGEGTTVFEDLHSYMGSLQKLKDLRPSIIYPAHGPVVTNPIDKLTFYIEHRMARERQVLGVLQSDKSKAFTPMQIMEKVYEDLAPGLKPAATNNVVHHLNKLLKDGKVGKL
ncbi:hypothetical protein FSP39_000731 [Pinctada imbricata]|uniref:Metallo-beta-lactamase domain-containing protein n=1 Tax=Pinctada imbricata TaxID=66713 RepID=A0AA88XT43_PINIB|nr:hypothetical protein FSP39_000731 [Pinctada imbricata]